jgi:multicomponent Na+:H+ antiporter subunit C
MGEGANMIWNNFIYYVAIIVFTCGLYIMMTSKNYFKVLIGLGIFQNSVLIFYIAIGKLSGGKVPVIEGKYIDNWFSSPLPQVLMLTAIVVGLATFSVGMALILKINNK